MLESFHVQIASGFLISYYVHIIHNRLGGINVLRKGLEDGW